jgi:tetratricopeptide (TPR) repeat protein
VIKLKIDRQEDDSMVSRRVHHHKEKAPYRKQRLRDVNLFPKAQSKLLGEVPQDLLGISDDQLSGMYQIAWAFLEAQQNADAVRSFTLLCHLHPYVPDFWYGLGKALRECGEPEDALSMLLVAETIDPTRFEFYEEEIECCLQMGRQKEAVHILHRMNAHSNSIAAFSELGREVHQLEEKIALSRKTHPSTTG